MLNKDIGPLFGKTFKDLEKEANLPPNWLVDDYESPDISDMISRTKTGIIIGRFQVPKLHIGHIYLISSSLQECDKTVVLLGCLSADKGETDTDKNPYTILHRVTIIKTVFPQVDIIYLWDKKTDKVWSKQVDMLCSTYDNPILYHSRDSFKDHYSGKHPLEELPEIPEISGTKLRK